MNHAELLQKVSDRVRNTAIRVRLFAVSGKATEILSKKVGKTSLGRTAKIAFGIQGLFLLILGIASFTGVSSALVDVADLNGVVKQQRLLLNARIAVVESSDKVKAYALTGNSKTETTARNAVAHAADAVQKASDAALNDEQVKLLHAAADAAAETPKMFEQLVKTQNAVNNQVREKIHVEGGAIQTALNRLAENASLAGQEKVAAKAREASAAYSLVRIDMEHFISDPSKDNIAAAKQQSLALESVLNELYDATQDPKLLAEADGVIKRLINYDIAFLDTVKLTGARRVELDRLLVGHAQSVGRVVDRIGAEVDAIQSGAASSARLKLGGLLTLSLLLSSLGLLFVVLANIVFRRAVTGPILEIADDMERIAKGQFDHQAAFTERADEVGDMARALEVFRLNAIEVQRLQGEEAESIAAKHRADQLAMDAERRSIEERQAAQADAEQAKRRMLAELAVRFENQVARAMDTVAQAALEIDAGAQRVASTVASSKEIAAAVTDAAVEASSSTATIASATEEMSLSLAEVSKQVLESSHFASRAVDRVGQTDEIVTSLARDAAEIGEVVSLVHNIAQQVNLLALNATIEASRAGEAGRGFAVVAAEVKSLAQQTASATAHISERVSSIQNISQTAMQAINEIGQVISEMGVLAASVAIAVEQQVSTTAEIARNTTLAATGTSQVTGHLRRVQEGVSISGDAAETARIAAEEVSRQTEALQKEIDSFLASVRAA